MIVSTKASKTAQPATYWNEKIQENKKHFLPIFGKIFSIIKHFI